MLYTSFNRNGKDRRRGVILLIVIAMLTLFAVVGLSFVFYAESVAASSNVTVQGLSNTAPDADPELLLSYFLSQLIYDTTNNYSAMRGHSLTRSMYGSNQVRSTQFGQNFSAYSGIGRIHKTYGAGDPAALAGFDDFYLPSYIYYPKDGFIRDPEFYGWRDPTNQAAVAANYRAGNAPYTYPDMNNLFLARVDADGSVIAPSFHRAYLSPLNKYSVLFPSVSYHNQFSVPDVEPTYMTVRNLENSKGFKYLDPNTGAVTYYNNDSCWLDLGWPVMTAPNGKKYKVMFAPLVIDLDNRINMWVAGNYNGNLSNRGYGPNEINPLVFPPLPNPQVPLINPKEFNQNAANLMTMRYGSGTKPIYPVTPAQWPQSDGPPSSRIDFDGMAGGPLTLPDPNNGNYTSAQYFIWPDYPRGTYDGTQPWYAPATELGFHPLGYNIFLPTPGNNPLPPASNMEAILRHMGTGAPAATSGFFKTMPKTFSSATNRGLLTSLSWNLDRITAAPYIPYALGTNTNYSYDPVGGQAYPKLVAALTSPNFANAAPAGSEFTASFNSALVNRLRINLNRLSQFDYPTPDASGFIDLTLVVNGVSNANKFKAAQDARVALAQDIYNVLVAVTGAQDPMNPANQPVSTTSQPFMAARWLAQLAVNIVDYIENDDISTPFPWYTDPTTNAPEIVYGTEAPRLVLNEAYAQLDNNYNDFLDANGNLVNDASKWTAVKNNVNVWVELHNPFKGTPAGETYPFDNSVARLNVVPANQSGPYAAYQIVLSQPDVGLRDPGNNPGDGNFRNNANFVTQNVTDWGMAGTEVKVLPANGAFNDLTQTNNGFFVLGSSATFLPATPIGAINTPPTNPNLPVTYATPQMSISMDVATQKASIDTFSGAISPTGTTILLRRLACPYLPPSASNPYITVDYVENIKTWDERVAPPPGNTVNAAALPDPDPNKRSSSVRKEPYAASYMGTNRNNQVTPSAQYFLPNNKPAGQDAMQPLNTFFRHNSVPTPPVAGNTSTFTMPFNWLVHLDRPVVNGLELLHVSGYRPHELTQQFIPCSVDGAGVVTESAPFKHYAPWSDQSAMIYRALELVGVPSYLNGTSMAGRVPGKININTMNEPEVWRALCDFRPGPFSTFTQADVDTILQRLKLSRTTGGIGAAPGANDVPFRSFAAGWINPPPPADPQYPNGAGIGDTLLRNGLKDPTKPFDATTNPNVPLFTYGVPPVHPYQQNELLQKIYNNTTTTSNVFAVWLTAGFFEVVDDTVTPAKIGSEIGRDQGRQVRHRMFAIVDRSQLTLFTTKTQGPITAGNGVTVTVASNSGTLANGNTWSIQTGMLLEIGKEGNSEVVAVTAIAGNTFTANFTQTWPVGTPVVCRGNPGPQPAYNPRNDSLVVPHFTIIQ